jgi:hypothetical protein
LKNDSFIKKTKTDSTKDTGLSDVAKYYKVEQDWTKKKTMGCIKQGQKNTLIC